MKFGKKIFTIPKNFISKISKYTLNTPLSKAEFIFCIVLYIICSIAISPNFRLVDPMYNGIYGQLMQFISIYIAFRFAYVGLSASLILNFFQANRLLHIYFASHNPEMLIAITTTTIAVIVSTIVSILSNMQHVQKKKLEQQKQQLEQLSITDALTSVYNQRHFHQKLEEEINRASLKKDSVGLIMVDIDNFKVINDLHGHAVGDSILKGVAQALKDFTIESSIVCRYGGDEFAIILPGAKINDIEKAAFQIRDKHEQLKNNYYEKDFAKKITFSMGLSEYPNISKSKNNLISQADLALYHAKNLGKDKIHLYHDIIQKLSKSISPDDKHLIGIFSALLSSISIKDKYTLGHCERVSSYAVMVGKKVGLSFEEINTLQYAGLLHDIGKVDVPASVLNKIERMTDEEFDLLKNHPVYGANILEPLSTLGCLTEYVKQHHERFDGKGYPDGLSGRDISLGARILCVVDSFDAMISVRPYSKSMSIEEAFAELKRCSGAQFDPEIVDIFIELMSKKSARNINYVNELCEMLLGETVSLKA